MKYVSTTLCLFAEVILLVLCSMNSAYGVTVGVAFQDIVGNPLLPDLATYTLTSEAGDPDILDFHLEFPKVGNYVLNNPLPGWVAAQNASGLHWTNPAGNNPILPGQFVDFTAQLNDSEVVDAWDRVTNNGTICFGSSAVLYNYQNAGLVNPGDSKSHVETNVKIITPAFGHIDSKGVIYYIDAAGNKCRGTWLLSSEAVRVGPGPNDWDYIWELSNNSNPAVWPGGVLPGWLADYEGGFYPEKAPKGPPVGRWVGDWWPAPPPPPGGFDSIIFPGNELLPGQTATVELWSAPGPRIGWYRTHWNPESESGERLEPIPEPLTMLGVFLGVCGLGRYVRRRRLA